MYKKQSVQKQIRKNLSKLSNTANKIAIEGLNEISYLGSYQFYIIIMVLFFATKKYNEFIFLILGFFIINVFLTPIRLMYYKERPKPKQYTNILEKIEASSFPSMHGARTVFLSLFLINYLKYNTIIAIFLVFIILLVSYSRVYRQSHYWIDVICGKIFGFIFYFGLKYFLYV